MPASSDLICYLFETGLFAWQRHVGFPTNTREALHGGGSDALSRVRALIKRYACNDKDIYSRSTGRSAWLRSRIIQSKNIPLDYSDQSDAARRLIAERLYSTARSEITRNSEVRTKAPHEVRNPSGPAPFRRACTTLSPTASAPHDR